MVDYDNTAVRGAINKQIISQKEAPMNQPKVTGASMSKTSRQALSNKMTFSEGSG